MGAAESGMMSPARVAPSPPTDGFPGKPFHQSPPASFRKPVTHTPTAPFAPHAPSSEPATERDVDESSELSAELSPTAGCRVAHASEYAADEVTLYKTTAHDRLGITLEGDDDCPPRVIATTADDLAGQSGKVCVGQLLLSVNGVNVRARAPTRAARASPSPRTRRRCHARAAAGARPQHGHRVPQEGKGQSRPEAAQRAVYDVRRGCTRARGAACGAGLGWWREGGVGQLY